MKASLFLAAIVPALCGHALDPRATACKNSANNCQRGVAGTNGKPALSVRMADCSSYLSTTVTPPETTTTVTATSYSYISTITSHTGSTETPSFTKRDVATETASPLYPAYATYCADAAAYYSACSCAGVTPAITTAPVSTVTYTATTTTVVTCSIEYEFRKRGWQAMGDFVDYAFH